MQINWFRSSSNIQDHNNNHLELITSTVTSPHHGDKEDMSKCCYELTSPDIGQYIKVEIIPEDIRRTVGRATFWCSNHIIAASLPKILSINIEGKLEEGSLLQI